MAQYKFIDTPEQYKFLNTPAEEVPVLEQPPTPPPAEPDLYGKAEGSITESLKLLVGWLKAQPVVAGMASGLGATSYHIGAV